MQHYYDDYPVDGGNAQGLGTTGGKKGKKNHSERGTGKNQKHSANHLLNFNDDVHHQQQQQQRPQGGGKRRSPPMGSAGHHRPNNALPERPVDPAVAKKAFILQNFQFVLTEAASYDSNVASRCVGPLTNFDELPWWEHVKVVICRENPEEHRCPICLDNPRCPRVTVCGHIFCFPCILRHLEYAKSKNQPKTCPVCSAMVLTQALRPVVWVPSLEPPVGGTISWTLLERNKDVCQVVCPPPRSSQEQPAGAGGDNSSSRKGRRPTGTTTDALTFVQRHVPNYGEPSANFSRYSLETEGLAAMVQATDCADLNERLRETGMDVEQLEAASLVNPTPEGELSYAGSNEKERALCEDCLAMVYRGTMSSASGAAAMATEGRTNSSLLNTREGSNGGTGGGGASVSTSASLEIQAPLPGGLQRSQKMGAVQPDNLTELYRCSDGQQVYLNFLNTRMLRDAFEGETNNKITLAAAAAAAGGGSPQTTASSNSSPQQGPSAPPPPPLVSDRNGCGGGLSTSTPITTGGPTKQQQLPTTFEAKIEDIETVLQTTATRTSYKSIGHVPLFSSFKMCFVDLRGVVPGWVMAKYKKQIDDRRRRLKAVREKDTETADRCLKDMWDDYRRDIEESHGGTGIGAQTPDVSPNTLAQMPNLSDVAPELDLGPADQGDAVEDEEEEEEDDGLFRPPRGGVVGATAWKGTQGLTSRAHGKVAAAPPAGATGRSAQWGGKTQVVIGGGPRHEDPFASLLGSTTSTTDKDAEKHKKLAQRQRKNDISSAMNTLFSGEETVWTEEGEAITFPTTGTTSEFSAAGATVGGKKGGKGGKGGAKGGKGVSISLTSGGRH